jgi:hypothetical protein
VKPNIVNLVKQFGPVLLINEQIRSIQGSKKMSRETGRGRVKKRY